MNRHWHRGRLAPALCAAVVIAGMFGCARQTPPPPTTTQPTAIAGDAKAHVGDLKAQLDTILAGLKTPQEQLDIPGLIAAVQLSQAAVVNIERDLAKLAGVQVGADAAAKRIADLEAKLATATSDSVKAATDKWLVIAAASAALAFVGMFLGMWVNPKLGWSMLASAGGMSLYATFMALASPALFAAARIVFITLGCVIGAALIIVLILFGKWAFGAFRSIGTPGQTKLADAGNIAGLKAIIHAAVGGGAKGCAAATEAETAIQAATPATIEGT